MVEVFGKLFLTFLKVMMFSMILIIIFPDIPKLSQQDSLLVLILGMAVFYEIKL